MLEKLRTNARLLRWRERRGDKQALRAERRARHHDYEMASGRAQADSWRKTGTGGGGGVGGGEGGGGL